MKRVLLKFSILVMAILGMGSMAMAPALANISAAFKEASPETIMQMMSLPAIMMVVTTLIFGKMAEFLSRRALFFLGMALFLVGGVVPYFLNDLTTILIMRAVFGASFGILVPLATVLISDWFEGNERDSLLGLQSVFVSVGGMIWSTLGGLLCVADWHNTFLAYLLGIVVVVLFIFFVPEPPKKSGAVQGNKAIKEPLGAKVYFVEGVLGAFNILVMVFFTNIAIQIVGENLGNAASAGFALTIFTIGGLLAGLVFGKTILVLKSATMPVGWIIMGIGVAIMAITHDLNLILVGCFISGLGFATAGPACYVLICSNAPPSRIDFSIALSFATTGVGQFVSPVIFGFINSQMGHVPGRFPILVSSIAFVIIGVLLLLQREWFAPPKAIAAVSE
ncbi:MAG TPA: MFS transporter [Negativicutes bacterium]|jgi:MFS family permease